MLRPVTAPRMRSFLPPIATTTCKAGPRRGMWGKLAECTSCHISMPSTVTGGPHGMHPTESDLGDKPPRLDRRATSRSARFVTEQITAAPSFRARRAIATLSFKGTPMNFWRGQKVSCYDCHNGVDTDDNDAESCTGGSGEFRARGLRRLRVHDVERERHRFHFAHRAAAEPRHGRPRR